MTPQQKAMTYNLGAGHPNANYLSQNELFNLNKQKNLKIGLKKEFSDEPRSRSD